MFTRTANAGGLLELDGVKILLDGVSLAVHNYQATPHMIEAELLETPIDLMAFTHTHADHFSPDFVHRYGCSKFLPALLGPETVSAALPGISVLGKEIRIGSVCITPVPSRHMGDARQDAHWSFLLKGSRSIWFLGDASPAQWRKRVDLPKPDILIAPFPYGSTDAACRIVAELTPKVMVLLHLPLPGIGSNGIWSSVLETVARHPGWITHVPQMGEKVFL